MKGYCNGLQEVKDDRISAILKEIKHSFQQIRRNPMFRLLTSPISMGIQTPVIILPAGLYRSIGDKELRAILLHELAHIYHYDHMLGLLQRLVKALYWWNPFVYGLCNSLSVAREEVSDNYAISGMESATSYARLLVSLVEKTSLISRMPCTAGMATPYESLETRIRNIVSKERDMRVKTTRGAISAIALAAIFLCGLVGIGSQVELFGIVPAASGGPAKPALVNIKNTNPALKTNLRRGSASVPEAPAGQTHQPSPAVSSKQGNSTLPEPLLLQQDAWTRSAPSSQGEGSIPSPPQPAVAFRMNPTRPGVSGSAGFSRRSADAVPPQIVPIRISGSSAPALRSRVELEYPPEARWAKISGNIRVEVTVNERGDVYEARVLRSHPWFTEAALDAVLQWRFEPLMQNGEPKPFVTTVDLPFQF